MYFPFYMGNLSVGRLLEEELHSTRNISALLTTGEDAVEALNRNTKVVALN